MSWDPRSWWYRGKGAATPSVGTHSDGTDPGDDDPSAKGSKGSPKGGGWPPDPWWGYGDGWTPDPWWDFVKGDGKDGGSDATLDGDGKGSGDGKGDDDGKGFPPPLGPPGDKGK